MLSVNILRGKTVRLTAVNKADLPTLVRWYQDAGLLRLWNADAAVPRSEAELVKWLDEEEKKPNGYRFAIRPLEGDDLLGYVEIDGILWPHQVGWLSIGIGDRTNWGQGYGREATELGLNFAFGELNLHRLQLTVFEYNARAIALYEKLGFRREGVYREFMQRDGQRYDMYLYGLLRPEWEAPNSIHPKKGIDHERQEDPDARR
ncbi:MAG: GNAT family N-acetyltransferase [Chloroflexi bacterium HGW-Chloroflexi-1]|nr:MAG: GNAT family N-acetyltransferase [Chloroflexi bacterium HGW-Chloroflexi-1]